MTRLCMPLMSLGEQKAMLAARLIKKTYLFLENPHSESELPYYISIVDMHEFLMVNPVQTSSYSNNVRDFLQSILKKQV